MGAASYLPRSRLDLGVAGVGLAISAVAAWAAHPNPVTDGVAGPAWLIAVYPFLLSLPLAWRRRLPFISFLVVMGAVTLQAVLTSDSTEGLQNLYCAGVAMYSAGRYCDRRRASLALAVGVLAYAIYAVEDENIRSGDHGQLWSGSFFGVAFIATWLVGVFVRNRRDAKAAEVREGRGRARAAQAVIDERARLARELHDIVSHNLSVVVVQAAGARARGGLRPRGAREDRDAAAAKPSSRCAGCSACCARRSRRPRGRNPGIGDLGRAGRQVRAAGMPVDSLSTASTRDFPRRLSSPCTASCRKR